MAINKENLIRAYEEIFLRKQEDPCVSYAELCEKYWIDYKKFKSFLRKKRYVRTRPIGIQQTREDKRKYFKEYRERHREKLKGYSKSYYLKRKKEDPEYHLRGMRDASRNLTDSYIKNLLSRGVIVKRGNIPDSLIELKRTQIMLKRQILAAG
jgi:hypothetical protein